jgi:hypothetical protein
LLDWLSMALTQLRGDEPDPKVLDDALLEKLLADQAMLSGVLPEAVIAREGAGWGVRRSYAVETRLFATLEEAQAYVERWRLLIRPFVVRVERG